MTARRPCATRRTEKHAVVTLPDVGRLVVSGDLHDHGLNHDRVVKLARLDESDMPTTWCCRR